MAAIAADGRARKHRFASVGCSHAVDGAVAAAAVVGAPVALGGRGRKASVLLSFCLCVVVWCCFVFVCCFSFAWCLFVCVCVCVCAVAVLCVALFCVALCVFVSLIVCSFAFVLFCFVVLCAGGGQVCRQELGSQSMRIS